jgi:hypothetical protein
LRQGDGFAEAGLSQFLLFFPRVGFIVTNFRTSSRAVVRFYNKRGMAEQ